MGEAVTGGDKKPPTAAAVRRARTDAGLTLAEAAALVYTTDRTWRYWESGNHDMPTGLWELFQLKVARLAEDRA